MSAAKLTAAQRKAYDEMRDLSGYESVDDLARRILEELRLAHYPTDYFAEELAYQLGREFKRGYDAGRAALASSKDGGS